LITALTHDVPEQDAALPGINQILEGGAEHIERRCLKFIGIR
jgi:hypothetical protein